MLKHDVLASSREGEKINFFERKYNNLSNNTNCVEASISKL